MIKIKKLNKSDFSTLSKFILIEKDYFKNLYQIGWTENNLFNQFKKNNNLSFGLFDNSNLQGILIGDTIDQYNSIDFELYLIYVAKNKRRMNYATKLLEFLELKLNNLNIKRVFIEVSELNHPAIHFYEKNNFVFLKFRNNYYKYKNITMNAKCYIKRYN